MKSPIPDPHTLKVLEEFKTRLIHRYGAHFREMFLFGSRARGDYRSDSDADVAVFLDHVADLVQTQLDMVDESYPMLLSSGIHIQPWVFEIASLDDPDQYRAAHLVKTVQREGVRI
jgi:antitoxin ChpS